MGALLERLRQPAAPCEREQIRDPHDSRGAAVACNAKGPKTEFRFQNAYSAYSLARFDRRLQGAQFRMRRSHWPISHLNR